MSHALGKTAEALAAQFLIEQGYTLIAQNYRVAKVGEIDIIARKVFENRFGKSVATLVCVEVKARSNTTFGRAIEMVSVSQQKRLIKTMSHFLQTHSEYHNDDVRFDVIAIDVADSMAITENDWVRGAFLAA